MEIAEFEITQYKNNIQSGFGFSVGLPDILRIQQEIPVAFQERVRQEGYPEFKADRMPDTGNHVFEFFSNKHEYIIGFQKNLLALIYNGRTIHYENIRTRIEHMMKTFMDLYSPDYFKGANLRHEYFIDRSFLQDLDIDLKLCVPTYIFPEVSSPLYENLYSLSKDARFDYNGIEIIANYDFSSIKTNSRVLYSISIGCLYEQDIGDINVILAKFDELKKTAWNILHSSITDTLREAMDEINGYTKAE